MPHLLIVEARFYTHISDFLAEGAMSALDAAGATYERIEVPGALEIPAAIQFAFASRRFDGAVALGCVIRGETTHYETVCNESARGLMDLSIQNGHAIGNGILTVENEAQALTRAKKSEGDKGGFAARTALRMIEIKQKYASGGGRN